MLYHISDHLHSQSCQVNRHFKLINAVIETAKRTGGYFVSSSVLYEIEQRCLKMGCIQGKQASWKCCSHYFKIILFSLHSLSLMGFQFPRKPSFQHIFDLGLQTLTFSFCEDWIYNGLVKNRARWPKLVQIDTAPLPSTLIYRRQGSGWKSSKAWLLCFAAHANTYFSFSLAS